MFGISSDKSEASKALLYPRPSDADMKVTHYWVHHTFGVHEVEGGTAVVVGGDLGGASVVPRRSDHLQPGCLWVHYIYVLK